MELGEYMLIALALSAVLGLIGTLAHPTLREECASLIGLLSLLFLISPAASLLSGILSPPEEGEIIPTFTGGGVSEVTEEAFALGLERYAEEQLSAPSGSVGVRVIGLDRAKMRAEEIRITLGVGAAVGNIRLLGECVRENFLAEGGRYEVVIDFEGGE